MYLSELFNTYWVMYLTQNGRIIIKQLYREGADYIPERSFILGFYGIDDFGSLVDVYDYNHLYTVKEVVFKSKALIDITNVYSQLSESDFIPENRNLTVQ